MPVGLNGLSSVYTVNLCCLETMVLKCVTLSQTVDPNADGTRQKLCTQGHNKSPKQINPAKGNRQTQSLKIHILSPTNATVKQRGLHKKTTNELTQTERNTRTE